MTWEDDVAEAFSEHDIDIVAYLPDSVLAPLIDRLEEENFESVLVAREEEAVAVLAGAWLGGKRGALVCQTSGLANTFNAIGSFTKPWGIPFLGVVSHRGAYGEHNLAQISAGYNMPAILDSMGVRNRMLDGSLDVKDRVGWGIETTFATEDAFIFLVDPTLGKKP